MADPVVDPVDSYYARNQAYAVSQPSYQTNLGKDNEESFRHWVSVNKQRLQDYNPDNPKGDYDMRGWWLANNGTPAPQGHFPDTYKTPYHQSFSNESKYAKQDAPRWKDNGKTWDLVDKTGKVVFSEPKKPDQ